MSIGIAWLFACLCFFLWLYFMLFIS